MRNVAGISQTDAQKNSDMFMKCRYMDELTGGRGITFATDREIPKSFCSDDETIGLVQEIYGTKVNKGICCVFCYNNLPAKNVLSEYVCDYKKRAGLFQRSADLE